MKIHWVEDEAELSEDVQDWKTKLTEMRRFCRILVFTQSDVQVGENYHELLILKFKNNEVRNMLTHSLIVRVYIKEHMRY